MAKEGFETFTERFNRLTEGLSRKQIGQLLDLTDGAVRKLQEGTTQSLKAHGAIALARYLSVPVEYLAERGPLPPLSRTGEPPGSSDQVAEKLKRMAERDRSPDFGRSGIIDLTPPAVSDENSVPPLWATREDLQRLEDRIDALVAGTAVSTQLQAEALEGSQATPATERSPEGQSPPSSSGRKAQ